MATTTRATSLHPPSPNKPYVSQSEQSYYPSTNDNPPPTERALRSLSPEDVQKLKYKIDLDKQVAEKQHRLAREWEQKIERDRKYVRHQPFGRHDRSTVLNPREFEEILTRGRAPSPVIDMPQQYPHHVQQQQQSSLPLTPGQTTMPFQNDMASVGNNGQMNGFPKGSASQNSSSIKTSASFSNPTDFQQFYGPKNNPTSNGTSSQGSAQAQLVKGDAHDPFSMFDPNKEGQNVFNTIPQQDLYDPWGRPGGGAPLIHAPTGQKFTRYSGSLDEKLNSTGPLGFRSRQYNEDIHEKKRELEQEQRRRQQEDLEFRSNAGNTAEWISQLEGSRYPLRTHLATTETTREITGARTRFRSEESRLLHDDLIRQADERARIHRMNRYHENIAEVHHSQAMNNWWGRSGGGAPSFTSRRHNVNQTFENPRQKWTTNHLGQLLVAEEEASNPVTIANNDFSSKGKPLSNHRNYYQLPEEEAS